MRPTRALDAVLDRSIVLGYTRLGSSLRRRWWPADPAPGSMTGKRVVVTGATSGIGEAMAAAFVDLGATVHLLGRNPDKVRASVAALRGARPGADVVEEVCDLSDLGAVRAWCADLVGRVPALHGLVHNAGTMLAERTETDDGHEVNLAAHVLGPHLMTELLLPVLQHGGRESGGASVVWMSSGGMYGAPLRDTDLAFERGEYDGVQAYARTKRMQVVLADAWARRLEGEPGDVRVESMHPGWVKTPGVADSLPRFNKVMGRALRTVEDGADTAVWLVATRPDSRDSMHFWHDRALRPTTVGWERGQDPARVTNFLAQVAALTGTAPVWS